MSGGRKSIGLALLLACTGAGAARVEAGVRPAEDLSTPEKAMVTFVWAYRIQDGESMARSTLWDDPKDLRRLFLVSPSNSINTVSMYRELIEIYAAKFPNDADAKQWIGDVNKEIEEKDQSIADDMKKFAGNISVKMEGDVATCTTSSESGGMMLKFKKVEGKWKLLPEFFGTETEDKGSDKYKFDILLYELATRTYEKFKTDVKAGMFNSFKQASEALTDRMMQVPAEAEKAMKEKTEKEGAKKE